MKNEARYRNYEVITNPTMTKTVYITLVYIQVVTSFTFAKSPQFVRSGNYVRKYWNGPDGECDAPTSKVYISDGCSAGWTKDPSRSHIDRLTSENKSGCRYFEKTTLFNCPKSDTEKKKIICWKSVSAYFIRPICAGVWLNWGECDAYCGVGKKTRVKFVSSDGKTYQQISESRPCKIRSCGEWSEWSDKKECKSGGCARIFQRNCTYNSTVSPIKLCSGRITDGNSTADIFEIACSPRECIRTTASPATTTIVTTHHETSTIVTHASSQSTTDIDETITTTTNSQSVANASEITVTNVTDIYFITVLSDNSTKDATFSALAQNQNSKSAIDIWKGLLIGVFAASFVYGTIAFFIYYRRNRKSSRNSRLSRDHAYYNHDKMKLGSTVIQERSSVENVTSTLLLDPSQSETLPHSQRHISRTNTLPLPKAPTIVAHCNQLCNDEPDPLYSNIPAFENVTSELPYMADQRDSIADSEDNEPRPDMFVGESESLDSEEMRDVLRTLKRPSSKFKKKAASLKESSISLLRSEFDRENKDRRSTIGTQGKRQVSKEFGKGKRPAFSGGAPFPNRTHQTANSTGSITSLNIDTATSGYNSSIADESTDDEYGGRILTHTPPTRQSRLRKSVKFLRRKLSMSQNKIIAIPKTGQDVLHRKGKPENRRSDTIDISLTNEDFPTCDVKPFFTMKPVRSQGFSVLSRNDRFVIIEDEYSLPIDAVTQIRPASPTIGYNVPIDAICKCSDPT